LKFAEEEWVKFVMNEQILFQNVKIRILQLIIEAKLKLYVADKDTEDFMDHLERLETHFLRLFLMAIQNYSDNMISSELETVVEFLNRPYNQGDMIRSE
jgi:hypothetical protein